MVKQKTADLSLLLITVIWGGTFPVIKLLVGEMTPHYLVGIRFFAAFLVLTLFCLPKLKHLNRHTLLIGTVLGLVLWGGYVTQTIGLQYTTASKGGFITGLSVVIVPVLSAVWLKKYPTASAVLGVTLATVGLGFLSLDFQAPYYLQYGDLLVLICALLYALQVVMVDRYAPKLDAALLAWVEIGVVAVAGLVYGAAAEPFPPIFKLPVIAGLLYLAVLATSLSQVVQIWAQRHTSPTRVGIILAMEPVFATFFATVFLREGLTMKTVSGCLLVLGGMLVAELNPIDRWTRQRRAHLQSSAEAEG